MPIKVRPVRNARERRTFLTFPWRVYRADPLWVPSLLPERAKVIDHVRGQFQNTLDRRAYGRHGVQAVEDV